MVERNTVARLIAMGIVVFLVYQVVNVLPGSLTGYPSAMEGAKAVFIGVQSADGTVYTSTQKHGASVANFDTHLSFDVDDQFRDMPNLEGEMTLVFIPLAQWIPPDMVGGANIETSWWRMTRDWKNPVATYSWEVPQPDGKVKPYKMDEWLTMWFVTISADFDSGPDALNYNDETQNQHYADWKVWVEFDISDTWYFEGAEKTHFAIASVEVSDMNLGGFDQLNRPVTPRTDMSVNPGSVGTPLYLYYAPYGMDAPAKEADDVKTFYARNTMLNPDYFRDNVYAYFTLKNFGTEEKGNILSGVTAKGDVVTYAFVVRQFVVGEWKAQPKSDIPDNYGRNALVGEGIGFITSLLNPLMDFFGSPGGAVAGILVLVVAALAVLAFSGMMPTLLALIFMRKRGDD